MVRKKKDEGEEQTGGIQRPTRGTGKPDFKGGKQAQRDKNFGIRDKDFWKWWHRVKKKEFGGRDGTQDEVLDAYDEWLGKNKPQVK